MFDDNIDLIQNPLDMVYLKPIPLVLFHDGGGTVFNYHMLGDLRRPVYGISNPHYGKETRFEGGMPEMARHYVDLMKKTVPSGRILIGGWSLGGLTSLEVARILADDDDFKVMGIVMLDSVCPIAYNRHSDALLKIVPHVVEWGENTRDVTKKSVLKCFADATAMVRTWELPTWGPELQPPPVILFKAKEPVPVLEDGVSRVDVVRNDPRLGWGLYRDDLIARVIDIPGNHYNIFHTEWRLDNLTEKVKDVCWDLERMSRDRNRAIRKGV